MLQSSTCKPLRLKDREEDRLLQILLGMALHSWQPLGSSGSSIIVLLSLSLVLGASGMTRVYDFQVVNTMVRRMGRTKNMVTVNGQFPGPTIYANDGDRLLIKVTNMVNHKMSIHWHGIRQMRTPWADGPAFVTQCPLRRGQSYLYNFTVDDHRGTLWWHAHIMWLRATVYGAIVIYPKPTSAYPYKNPEQEHMILLGEWWNVDVQLIEDGALRFGGGPNQSDAYTINGFPGPSYTDAEPQDVYKLDAIAGKTYLLRIINAGLNTENFFSIANHSLTVVEVDAEYTKPYTTDTIMLTPGQTTNVLVTADQACGKYYMSASPYMSAVGIPYNNVPATAIFDYIACNTNSATAQPSVPIEPPNNDTGYATQFTQNLRSLASAQHSIDVPQTVDKEFFMTVGLAIRDCAPGKKCFAPTGGNFTASINNVSFILPSVSIFHAYFYNISGVYTTDFPSKPPTPFNYTVAPPENIRPSDGTRVSVIPFGSNVQMVFQNTIIAGFENHPIHLHGYNFFVIGHGFGDYDASKVQFNLVDPPLRNTVGVPAGGWATIRFKADNPGVWYMHCHLEIHTTWGLATAFIVTNGAGPNQTVLPPPDDFPKC